MPWYKDGIAVGGVPEAHGSTHAFGGTDEIPGGEQLEVLYDCTATEAQFNAVYLSGSNAVRQADASGLSTMPVEGIIRSKPSSTSCVVVTAGDLGGFAGLTPDAPYFISDSTPGLVTAVPPSGAGKVIQQVGRALTPTILHVRISPPIRLSA